MLARSNPDRALAHKGLSMFLLEKDSYEGHDFEYRQPQGGVLTGRAIATIGYRGMHSYELFFDHVFVPDENLVGGPEGEGKGFHPPLSPLRTPDIGPSATTAAWACLLYTSRCV